ncbi:zinc finger and BTB domain-containing protein 41 [Drosophila grimshawi]|uniref:GH22696 n=1 Tax=Drosophila grimshawi TaxID=7222 RepID=B4JVC8_DROGR|nr:zinc finger and BTB domain-containing protein 41 [Drosophila grimshawi]EDV98396.1 GH22696 [Drosophila grimshawi]
MQDTPEPASSSRPDTSENTGFDACSICASPKSMSSALLDLSGNSVMQRRLNRDWKLPPEIIKMTLRAICVECVCKLNMHSEVTRSLMQRLQRLTCAGGKLPTARQSSPPIADAEVSTTVAPLAQEEIHPASSSHSSCSVLQAYSAQPPESPTATESGGQRNSAALDGWKWRTRLICAHCERAYFRRDLYTLHMRRCSRRRRHHQQQHRPAVCRVRNEAEEQQLEEEHQLEEDLVDEARQSRTFQCRHCEKEFAGIVAMRQHQRITHQSVHRCNLCEAEFGTKYEWELHHTICSAKLEALAEQAALNQPRSTRSRSRARSRALSHAWQPSTDEEEEEQEDEEEQDEDEEYNGEDDDDATSVADTMYTRRMNFTGDWIVNHSRSNSNSALNLSMLYDDYVLEESHITTEKEYDLHLLDMLKTQVQLKAFSCFAPGCYYKTDTLVDLMKHDYMHHWKMSWFYCHKCGDVFTSKVFLDYHLHRQNRGVYICHKCHDEFEFQHQLDRHQLMHSKCINYHCNYCRLEFLSEHKLLAHCEQDRHSPNDEPPLIHIEHALSICNPVPKEPVQVPQYSARMLNMPHRMWTKGQRPTLPLPHNKPSRLAIGICEFDNRKPPNCVGCQ